MYRLLAVTTVLILMQGAQRTLATSSLTLWLSGK